jgi:hypothetical protein
VYDALTENTVWPPNTLTHKHAHSHTHKVGMEVAELTQNIKLTVILRGKALRDW